ASTWKGKDDAHKYHMLRYHFPEFSEIEFEAILSSLQDPNYNILVLHDQWQKYPDLRHELMENMITQTLANTGQLSELGQQYHAWLQVFLLEKNEDWEKLSASLAQLSEISRWHQQMLWYYQAKLAGLNKQNQELQQINQKLLGNPF